jgi:hypothetical protein
MGPSRVAPWYRFTGRATGGVAAVCTFAAVCGFGVLRFGQPLGLGAGVAAGAPLAALAYLGFRRWWPLACPVVAACGIVAGLIYRAPPPKLVSGDPLEAPGTFEPAPGPASSAMSHEAGGKGMLLIDPHEPTGESLPPGGDSFEPNQPTAAPEDLSRALTQRRPRPDIRPLSRLRTP